VGVTCFRGLRALEWAWHIPVTNLRCVQGYRRLYESIFIKLKKQGRTL